MTDFDDDITFESGWGRTGADRTPYRRTRTHHVVDHDGPPTMPIEMFDEVDPWVEHAGRGVMGVDPRLVRVGAVAAAAVLMIPLALALREDDGGTLRADPSAITSTSAPAAPTTTVVTIPITAAAVAPAPAPAPAADSSADDGDAGASVQHVAAIEPPACAGTYTVVFNDYWNRFPESSGASVEEWLAANGASHDTPLYVGDELCIPEGATAPAPAPTTTAAAQTTAAPPTTAPPPPPPTTAPPPPPPAPVATTPPATTPPPTAAATAAQPGRGGSADPRDLAR